jgi:hypothetical protein
MSDNLHISKVSMDNILLKSSSLATLNDSEAFPLPESFSSYMYEWNTGPKIGCGMVYECVT